MKTVCERHHVAYDVDEGCQDCEAAGAEKRKSWHPPSELCSGLLDQVRADTADWSAAWARSFAEFLDDDED